MPAQNFGESLGSLPRDCYKPRLPPRGLLQHSEDATAQIHLHEGVDLSHERVLKLIASPSARFELATFGLEVQRAVHCATKAIGKGQVPLSES